MSAAVKIVFILIALIFGIFFLNNTSSLEKTTQTIKVNNHRGMSEI